MLLDNFDLEVRVAEAGYRLVPVYELPAGEARQPLCLPGPRLTEGYPVPGRAGLRTRQPDREEPFLFRAFADINPDAPVEVVAFANRWGFLYAGSGPPPGHREPLDIWRSAILDLRHATRVHDLMRAGDTKSLASMTRWEPGSNDPLGPLDSRVTRGWRFRSFVPETQGGEECIIGDLHRARGEVIPIGTSGGLWESVPLPHPQEEADPRLVAAAWLNHRISDVLQNGIAEQIEFGTDPQTGRRGLKIRPRDLHALLWLQFARSVATNAEERACTVCGRWFALVPKDRGIKVYCSDACKVRAFRERKKAELEEAKTAKKSRPKKGRK